MLKKGLFLLVVAGSTLLGCVKGPTPPHAAWPWGRDRDYDRMQTGGYIEASANVAAFGAAPEAAKPVSLEVPAPEKAPAARAPETPVLPAATGAPSEAVGGKAIVPTATTKPSETEGGKAAGSSFTITDIPVLPRSYRPDEGIAPSRDITADNPGKAPVSVAIVLDPASRNVATDKSLPAYAVVGPGTKEAVLRLTPKDSTDRFDFRYRYTWTIGDYRATHRCNEGYQVPFPASARATASATSSNSANGSQKHIVFFQVPKETPILPARKGVVVRMKTGQVDILHEDGTVGTYGHIGKLAEGLVVGKEVSTDEAIGVVGRFGSEKQGYLELSVWAPRLPDHPSPRAARTAGFDFVSFPLDFCSAGWSHCRAVKDGEVVSRNSVPPKPNRKKHRMRQAASGEH